MRRLRCSAVAVILWTAAVVPAQGQGPPSAIPPPPDQQTADCIRPTYATDALVCADPALLETDRQLVRLYDAAAAAGLRIDGVLTESSSEWLRRRSLCAFSANHRACVEAAYRERMSVVLALMAAPGGTAPLRPSLAGLTDGALRERVEAIDDLFERAKAARDSGQFNAVAFGAVVRWLRDQELAVHAEAKLRTFADPAMSNYWHRSRLKFPTLVEQELSRLPEPRH
jgi:uncharacterized protein